MARLFSKPQLSFERDGGSMADGVAAWLDRPIEKKGLDNLGTQQPCVFIYTRLLPGITNVTDRAHYFGFYPWFVRAFERRHEQASDKQFREMLRRADCLVTLIAERHAAKLDDDVDRHAGACPGRQKLAPAAAELEGSHAHCTLSVFTDRAETNKLRYFKNPLGGLGQYYLGQLRDEYHVLLGDGRSGVNYSLEVGEGLAEMVAQGLPEDAFFAAIEKDKVGLADLDALALFCPCAHAEPARATAHAALTRLLLEDATPTGQARRRTFDLLLRFFQDAALAGYGAELDPVRAFLQACYRDRLPGGAWQIGKEHDAARAGWALYARNEMMSLAWIAIFKICLDAMEQGPVAASDVGALCDALLEREEFAWRPEAGFAALLQQDRSSMPDVQAIDDEVHEFQFWAELAGTTEPSIETAVRLLVRLIARFDDRVGNYGEVGVPADVLAQYPLTLDSLHVLARRWAALDARDWLKALMSEALVAHQRVALRKLGQSGEDTFMLRSNDRGYTQKRPQERVVATQPRIRQAIQILRDLDFIGFHEDSLPRLTERGQALAAMAS